MNESNHLNNLDDSTSFSCLNNSFKAFRLSDKLIDVGSWVYEFRFCVKIVEINKDFNEQIGKGEVLAIFDQNPFTLSVKESQTSVDISKSKLKQKQASLEKAKSECYAYQSIHPQFW